ncbi:hypothetical protein QP157_11705 [Sphingomonas sp. LR61]
MSIAFAATAPPAPSSRSGPVPVPSPSARTIGSVSPVLCRVSTTTKSPAANSSVDHGTRDGRSSAGDRNAATTTSTRAPATAAIQTVTPAVSATTSATSTADAAQNDTGSDGRRTDTGV